MGFKIQEFIVRILSQNSLHVTERPELFPSHSLPNNRAIVVVEEWHLDSRHWFLFLAKIKNPFEPCGYFTNSFVFSWRLEEFFLERGFPAGSLNQSLSPSEYEWEDSCLQETILEQFLPTMEVKPTIALVLKPSIPMVKCTLKSPWGSSGKFFPLQSSRAYRSGHTVNRQISFAASELQRNFLKSRLNVLPVVIFTCYYVGS